MNQIDLSGRVAVITGGTRGIGLAIVERMAKSGARVAVWDRARLEKGSKAEAAGAALIAADVSDPDAVARALAETESRVGPVDILVNSAAIGGVNTTVAQYPLDEWRAVMDVNLTGTFLTCRAVAPGMEKRGYGRIVNIASIAGKEGNPNASPYSASKAGVIALTKSLGKELATTGVCVNCIAPAVIETEMLEQSTKEHIAYMVPKIPMGRVGQVDEVAALVVLARLRGVLVLDRRGVRHFRRPRDVLGKAPMPLTIYGIKNCDSMKKARAFLDKAGVAYAFHDYKTAGIDKGKLEGWAKKVGWETLLNKAGTTFRKLPDKDKEGLTETKAIKLMLAQPSIIKRPVLELGGSKLLVGFKPEQYEAAL